MRLSSVDLEHLGSLRKSAERTLGEAIGEVVDVALLDAPSQVNVSDSPIWAGEMAHLRRMGLRRRYMADLSAIGKFTTARYSTDIIAARACVKEFAES